MSVRKETLKYLSGYGNVFSSESLVNALPKITGSAFTMPRHLNKWAWFYRTRPSVCMTPNASMLMKDHMWHTPPFSHPSPPDAMRWPPAEPISGEVDFVSGVEILAANGSPQGLAGGASGTYAFTKSMSETGRFMQNSDADLLIVPQEGTLRIDTEHGAMDVEPLEIAVIPRGIRFQINKLNSSDASVRGYLLENYGAHFIIPDLGPIGSNTGLAHPRHFLSPVANVTEEVKGPFTLVNKYQGHMWEGEISHSPLNVVAWHGNYAPSKYDLRLFCSINSVSFDHPDPSIYTVLTSPSAVPGLANIDFVIFPPRWCAMENSFRPPWYHRNVMSEFMGLITGVYDAKPKDGKFTPGGASIHNNLTPHGPDYSAYQKAVTEDVTVPQRYRDTMAFMFESSLVWQPTQKAIAKREKHYADDCWVNPFQPSFDPKNIGVDPHKYPMN